MRTLHSTPAGPSRTAAVPVRAALIVCLGLLVAGCGGGADPQEEARLAQSDLTDLRVTDLSEGTGEEARPGQRVSVHYTGWLFNPNRPDNKGREFDSSRPRGEPFQFRLGQGEVIEGWDLGVAGMRVGGQRRLTIPARLAYGSRAMGDAIPANATLVFDVQLVGTDD
jgi:FKBP-type peptidyl-prolyl cis-trans isomerase FkpA